MKQPAVLSCSNLLEFHDKSVSKSRKKWHLEVTVSLLDYWQRCAGLNFKLLWILSRIGEPKGSKNSKKLNFKRKKILFISSQIYFKWMVRSFVAALNSVTLKLNWLWLFLIFCVRTSKLQWYYSYDVFSLIFQKRIKSFLDIFVETSKPKASEWAYPMAAVDWHLSAGVALNSHQTIDLHDLLPPFLSRHWGNVLW